MIKSIQYLKKHQCPKLSKCFFIFHVWALFTRFFFFFFSDKYKNEMRHPIYAWISFVNAVTSAVIVFADMIEVVFNIQLLKVFNELVSR